MSVEYIKLVDREESALFVTLISLGFQQEYFEKALGWQYGVNWHKYELGGHYVAKQDLGSLRQLISEKVEVMSADFWADYIHRCEGKGGQLIETAQRLSSSPVYS